MMENLRIALEIRRNVFRPDDPMVAIIYRQMYDVSGGSVPPEVALDWLKNSVDIWERVIEENRRPPFLNTTYMNTAYQRLARLYRITGQSTQAEEILRKIVQ